MAVGRITGPLLKQNLLRDGVNLAFETDLLYIDVIHGRIGIKTSSPQFDLDVNGTTRTTTLEVNTQATIGVAPGDVFTLSGNTIASSNGTIYLQPSGTGAVVYQGKLLVNNNLQLTNNAISTTVTDADLNINTLGTGVVNINSDMLVNGNLHATGVITADGDIQIGSTDQSGANEDTVTFYAEVASDIIPDVTDFYNLGSDPLTGGKAWGNAYLQNIHTDNLVANSLVVNGIDLTLNQGNILYVASNGSDTNLGRHENNPVATIEHAFSLATAGDTVYVFPGVYEERFPLEVPPGVTVHGTSLRSVAIKPTAATMYYDAFHMNGEATVEDFTIMGFHHDPTGSLPEFIDNSQGTGHAFRFSANTTTKTRSPYIRNITVLTFGTASVLAIDSQKTETIDGLNRIKSIIDLLVVNGSITKTPANPLNPNTSLPAADLTTGTLLQNLIDDVIYIINNGTLKANLPSIVANGTSVSLGVLHNAAAILTANKEFLKEEITAYVTATYPTPGFVYDIATCQRDMGYIVDALIYDITRGGNEHSVYAGLAHWIQPTNDPRGYNRADAGHGALIDGSAVTADSKEAAMLFHSVTFITPSADTLIATNGARVEWLNSFTYFAGKGLYAYSSDVGFAGAGLTRLRINTLTGTWAPGDTVTYYNTDGTTVLATGVIDNITGDYVNLTGRCLGFETITDRVGKTIYPQGGAKLSTAQKKFGPTSLALDGVGDYLTIPTQPDFAFGTEAWCTETWIYKTTDSGTVQTIFDFRNNATAADSIILNIQADNSVNFYANGGPHITSTATIALNTWTHVALACDGTSTKLFINGTQSGSTYTDNNNYIQGPLTIGARFDGTIPFFGYMDDVRISKGVARYTGTFTAPAVALTGDLNTVLLLHFNGSNNSTTILDDGVTLQDLRSSSGGTATLINFADYSDFGAEIRAIGSANVYGQYGAYGDGPGVIGYLISQNFAYVGAGNLTNNDPNDRIAANEVKELNGARIYRTSVDNEGNFSVGDSFYVNQKTGEVLFNSQALNITSTTGVTFTDGVHTTIITATDITTGNIIIHDNNIDSLTGDVNVSAASGAINLQNTTNVTGDLHVTGDVNIGGNITIGDASTDTINFVGSIDSNLIPSTTAFYNIGTDLLRWKTAFLNRVEIDSLVIDSNTISTTAGNDDLTLIANGTGRIYVPSSDVQINQNLTVTQDFTVTSGTSYLKNVTVVGDITQTGDIHQTGNFVTSGNTQVTGNITGTGYLQLPEIRISGNTISTTTTNRDLQLTPNGAGDVVFEGIKVNDNNIRSTVTNSDITLVPQGTGGVIVNSNQSVQIPVGDNSQRPGTPTNGMIRYNTELDRYEGYSNGYWTKLGGIQDVDGNTYILAEATPGANDNVLYFYADGTLTATIDSTKLFTTRFQTVNLDLQSNTISPVLPNSDLNLTTTGSGGVRLGNIKIFNNTITNVSPNAVTEFSETGAGYVRIAGVNGVVIPSGDTLNDRPLVPEIGMMRFNTDEQLVEVFNGVTWTSVAGSSGGVTTAEATDLGITSALIFG